MTIKKFNEQRTGVLALLHATLAEVENHHNTLERKMQYNLTFMSSIAALEIVIHLHLISVGTMPNNMKGAAIVFGLVYLALASLSLVAIWPQSRASLPFEPTPEKVREWWAYDILQYRDAIIKKYVTIWTENQKLLDEKVRWTQLSYFLVVVALIVVLLQVSIYRHHLVTLVTNGSAG